MRAVHSLEVFHRVPVVLHEDHRVRSGEVEAQAPDRRGHHETVDGGVAVEPTREHAQIHESSWEAASELMSLKSSRKNAYSMRYFRRKKLRVVFRKFGSDSRNRPPEKQSLTS